MSDYSIQLLYKLKRVVLAFVVVVFIGLAIGTGAVIYFEKENQLETAGKSVQSLALVLSKEADSTLTLAESTLDSLMDELDLSTSGPFLEAETLHHKLKAKRTSLYRNKSKSSFAHIFILNKDGFNVANSVAYPTKRINAAERAYFKHHKKENGKDIHISQPHYSKVTEEKVIFITKRISNDKGDFKGIIGIHLKLSHFDSIYSLLKLPPGGTVTVVRTDGVGVFRYPLVDSFFKTRLGVKPTDRFHNMVKQGEGFIISSTSPYDGAARVVGYNKSQNYPLINFISITQTAILQNWLFSSLQTVAIASIGGLCIAGLAWFSYRQIGYLSQAMRLSNFDPLTALQNRRSFDTRYDEEWRRATRRARPLSLLFVDIDHFKKYNDHYGHREGDKCLKTIANALSKSAMRGGEIVARYGGEEFIILLPDTDRIHARERALSALEAIQELKLPHAASPVSDIVTVSIGVATMTPSIEDIPGDFIDYADDALYKAKDDGRNRIAIAKF